ncbi:spondin-2 [Anabrus simplex]|uniref:spondin-2 n=1 Tax=Anabrus simplex TaxID=316456 RepID=UPI0034DD3800
MFRCSTVGLLFVAVTAASLNVSRERCLSDRLAVYHLEVHTHWTRELFPKQFPEWRPPAQWSKLVGRSHDRSFSLFRVGEFASDGLQTFAESGKSDGLEALSQAEAGVFDEFGAPPIATGQGQTEAEFFTDGNHTKVSVVTRMVPSPDWFIGLDSLDLCKGGYWIDTISISVSPLDAGTDNGFTFTSPNWPSDPHQRVSRITAQHPNHPANSFYYPEMSHLPSIATFKLRKERIYKLSEESNHASPSSEKGYTIHDLEAALQQDELSNDVLPIYSPEMGTRRRRLNKHRRFGKNGRRPVPCQVGSWSPWSACSVSCGVGESSRTRKVERLARRGGRPCPPLEEIRWCGGHTDCPQRFFKW